MLKFNLSDNQIHSLNRGKNVQLKHADLGVGKYDVPERLINQVKKGIMSGKGIRINMGGQGITMGGQGVLGPKFDKKLKYVGIKKEVFSLAKKARPVLNNYMDSAILSSGNPTAMATGYYAKSVLNNYMDEPSKYQSTNGVKELLTKSAKPNILGGRLINPNIESKYHTMPYPPVNPFLPTNLINKKSKSNIVQTMSGGSINKAKKIYNDGSDIIRADQAGFDAPWQFIERPQGYRMKK